MHMRTIILLTLVLAATPTVAATTAEQIRQTANRFLGEFAEELSASGYEVRSEVGRLDPRLALAPCAEPLAASFTGDPWESNQPTLQMQCEGQRPWRMFLPVSVTIEGELYSAAQPIGRGERLTESMIERVSGVMNASRRRPITQLEDLLGKEMTRSINRGTVLTPNLVVEPDAVQRGDHVIITARSGNFTVNSRGKALANGRPGEQVMVENLSSSRRIRGRVVAPGRVEIPM